MYFKEEILPISKEELKKNNKYHVTYDKYHVRIEKREFFIENDISWLNDKNKWSQLSSIGMLISERTEGQKTSIEYSYFILSMNCTAEEFGKYKRSHWSIENKVHWVLDVSFNEDKSRIRKDNAQENLSVIRHMVLNLLKQEKTSKLGVNSKRYKCCCDNKYLEKVLGLI